MGVRMDDLYDYMGFDDREPAHQEPLQQWLPDLSGMWWMMGVWSESNPGYHPVKMGVIILKGDTHGELTIALSEDFNEQEE